MKKYEWNLDEIKEAVKESINLTEVLDSRVLTGSKARAS